MDRIFWAKVVGYFLIFVFLAIAAASFLEAVNGKTYDFLLNLNR